MVNSSHEFVAERLWLLVAVVTFPLTALAAVLGGIFSLPGGIVALLVTGLPITGWFLLTPILLMFGEEVADAVVGPPSRDDATEDTSETTEDSVESLKRRYANGELGEAEFERRLDQLLALDEQATADRDGDSLLPRDDSETSASVRWSGYARDDEDLLERE